MTDRIPITRRIASVLAFIAATSAWGCATPRTAEPPASTKAPASTGAPASTEAPAAVALPAGEETALRLNARGTQNYQCRVKHDAPGEREWVLVAPEAELFDSTGKKVGKHYAGPTWESTEDGSKVAATLKARAESPEADAIPWLLLTVTQATGDGVMAGVKSVQRTDTHGGKAPPGACSVDETLKVPYTAVYWFSRAKRAQPSGS
jgi:hypothetical protein